MQNKKLLFSKGFTFIELLIIVAIIGLLASIIIAMWAISAQNKAAVNAYKTSMESVRAAAEMCQVGGGTIKGGVEGSSICDYGDGLWGQEKYPKMPAKCGSISSFEVSNENSSNWKITTNEDCRGCRLICSTENCQPALPPDDQCK